MNKKTALLILAGFILTFLTLIVFYRREMLIMTATFLVKESDWKNKTYDYAVIPGGQPIERSVFAACLFREGRVRHVVCLGGNYPKLLRLAEDTCSEGRLSAVQLLRSGVPDSCITVIPEGTSTQQELLAFERYVQGKPGSILMITSRFHTRRAFMTLKKLLKEKPRPFDLAAAPNLTFDESNWWRSEEGLITINNEYLKLLYYLYKY